MLFPASSYSDSTIGILDGAEESVGVLDGTEDSVGAYVTNAAGTGTGAGMGAGTVTGDGCGYGCFVEAFDGDFVGADVFLFVGFNVGEIVDLYNVFLPCLL